MAAAKRIICVGHAALDRIYRIDAFPAQPTKVRALEHIETGGGMAANAAVAIARLGGGAELWSRVGDDNVGHTIRAGLRAERVDVRYVQAFEGARSSTSAIIVDDKGERLIVDNEIIMPFGLAGLGGAELDARDLFENPTLTYLDGAPAASMHTGARLKLFDDWGVDAGVIFPTIGILWDKEDDPDLAIALETLRATGRRRLIGRTAVGLETRGPIGAPCFAAAATDAFVLPTSVMMQPGFRFNWLNSCTYRSNAPTGTHRKIKSAPSAASRRDVVA